LQRQGLRSLWRQDFYEHEYIVGCEPIGAGD